MAEIDFDELDKAVNSIMSNANSSKKSSKNEQTQVTQVQSEADTPKVDAIEPEASDSMSTHEQQDASTVGVPEPDSDGVDTPTVSDETVNLLSSDDSNEPSEDSSAMTQPLANKRRGQFMDMKHPSADMKTSTAPAPITPSRVGVTLSPLSSDVKPDIEKASDADSPNTKQDAPTDTSEDADLIHSNEVSDTASDQTEHATADEPTPATDVATEDTEPMTTSPFLPDAKVEKRPLGTPIHDDEQVNDELDADKSSENEQDAADQTDEAIEPAQTPSSLPKELHSSVLEVEADTTVDEAPTQATEDSDEKEQTRNIVADTASEVAPHESKEFAGPSSIPPQYNVKDDQSDSDENEPQTSMYDSAADHPALAEHKKSSHWVVAIVIFLMLLLGAAGGAGLYLYQTGSF